MKNWVDDLTFHYEAALGKYPGEKLLIVCDIDQTILDMRHGIVQALLGFDGRQGSRYFDSVGLTDVDGNEDRLQSLFEQLQLPSAIRLAAGAECEKAARSREVILSAHRRFQGILDLIRWFQLQPNTYVALITGRPEWSRLDTSYVLSVLEREYCVRFPDDLVYMKPAYPKQPVWESKINGIARFREAGFHVFAAIDSEPENLRAIAESNLDAEIFLLQTDAIVNALEQRVVGRSGGGSFHPEKLLSGNAASRPVRFIWDWTDMEEETFFRFLSSNVQWIKVDAGFFFPDTERGRFSCARSTTDLDFCLNLIRKHKKKLNIDLSDDGLLLGRIMDIISDYDFEDNELWFSGGSGLDGHRDLKVFGILGEMYPSAVLQYSLGSLALTVDREPDAARAILLRLSHEGVDIFSLDWRMPHRTKILRRLNQWGFHVNICNAHSLRSFLQGALSQPSAITSAFNFSSGERLTTSFPESGDHGLISSLVA